MHTLINLSEERLCNENLYIK
ncbi:hypothetical protein EHRUM3_03820, partial [Ehrlichia ruminantium]